MQEVLENKLREIYDSLVIKPKEVYDIFCHHFGEHRVDIQGIISFEDYKIKYASLIKETKSGKEIKYSIPIDLGINSFRDIFIFIHFPEVRVTNENNRFIDIYDAYIKIRVTSGGTLIGYFTFNRSTYTQDQLYSGYSHSHVSGGCHTNDLSTFQSCCLGSGPIRGTISNLNNEFDEYMWALFCIELENYIKTESLNGGPYRRLEEVGGSENGFYKLSFDRGSYPNSSIFKYGNNTFKSFVIRLLESNKIKYNYINSTYNIGMSYIDYVLTISNEYIKWINESNFSEDLFSQFKSYLIDVKIRGDGFVFAGGGSNDYNNLIGRPVLTFKDQSVTFKIINSKEDDNIIKVLKPAYINKFTSVLLLLINNKYGNNTSSPNIGEKTRYI